MPRFLSSRRLQAGLTLVELMVAITLGLLVTAGVASLYLQGSRSYAQDDRYARMQEHARYALDIIAEDLKMADFWGEMLAPDTIGNPTPLTAGEDCGIGILSGASAVLYDNNSGPTTSSVPMPFDNTTAGCAALTGTVRPATNLLAIKRVSGTAITAGQALNAVYLRTNATAGDFFKNPGATPAGFRDWLYSPRIYFIRNDAVPSLCRLDLLPQAGLVVAFGAVPPDGCLAEGAEQMHIQFGIDTDNDGLANRYLSNPTAAQADTAVSARVYLLIRSAEADFNYSNNKTYVLGDLNIGPFNDNFYRRVLSTTVPLRNTSSMIVLNNS